MGKPGILELVIILLIIVLLFGGKKLRSFGADFGAALRGFKKEISEDEKNSQASQDQAAHKETSEKKD